MNQRDRRPIILLPTSDPRQHVQLMTTAGGKLAPVVLSAPMPEPSECARWIGQRAHWTRAARPAAHARGLKLRGPMCSLLYFDELSESEQEAVEQLIIAAEYGFTAPEFDAPTTLAELRWGADVAPPEVRRTAAAAIGQRGGEAQTPAQQRQFSQARNRDGRPPKEAAELLCTCGRGSAPHGSTCRIYQTEYQRARRKKLKNSPA